VKRKAQYIERADVLIVEDEDIVAWELAQRLQNLELAVTAVAESGEEAVQKAADLRPDLVLWIFTCRGRWMGSKRPPRSVSRGICRSST
jgi:PleD family two-component response regulator